MDEYKIDAWQSKEYTTVSTSMTKWANTTTIIKKRTGA